MAKYSGGALYIIYSNAKFDDKCSTYNTALITFYQNRGGTRGSIYCRNTNSLRFIGTVYFNESNNNTIRSHTCNITFVGTTHFHRNSGNISPIQAIKSTLSFLGNISIYRNTGFYGGAIASRDSNIVFSGLVRFVKNEAYRGGAIWLTGTSKLVLKPRLCISFISNYARRSGGALYFRDSRCLLR